MSYFYKKRHLLLQISIAPKATNFDPLSVLQRKNIYKHRLLPSKRIKGLTPFDMMAATYPEVIQKSKIKKVDRRAINLTPSLLASK